MNLELLNRTLEVTENPGLDSTDPRLDDIGTLIQEADYLGAAAQSEAILEEGIYDIRVIGFFLYGVFLEQGFGTLAPVFQCLSHLLRENWEALGPASKREKHAQTSLRWLVNQLLKKFQYEEGKKSDRWSQWIGEVSSEEVEEILDAGEGLRRALGLALEEAAGPVLDGLVKVNDWLRAFQRVVYREPEPEPEPEAEPVEAEELAETGEPAEMPAPRRDGPRMDMSPVSTDGEGVYAEGSYHLKLLLKKMEAFEQLIAEQKFPRAALVADDINEMIASFDPKLYFPKLFRRFSMLLAIHIADLSAFEEHKGTIEWQTMKEFYKVDLDSFVEF